MVLSASIEQQVKTRSERNVSDGLKQYEQYLRLILVRKRLFLTVSMIIMTVGTVAAYVLPKQYEAESTVYIDQNVITDLVKGIAITPSVEAKIKTLSVTLLSRTILLKVLSALDKDLLHNEVHLEEYLKDLTKRIKINYKEKEGTFKISLRDKDPAFARDFINTLTRKYIEDNTSSKREESLDATKFLGEQIESFKKRIDAAEDAINRYKSEKGLILATDDLFLRGEIADADKKLEELSIKRSALEARKRIIQEETPNTSAAGEAQARLSELRARYTDTHPKVIAAKAALVHAQSGKGMKRKHMATNSIEDSPEMLQVQIDAIKEMEKHSAGIISNSKDLLREIPAVRATLLELNRKKQNEEVVYQQLVSRYGQSEVSKQMELQDKSVTFRILDPAIKPLVPVSPNRFLIIVGSIFGGFALAFGIIWLLELARGGVRSPADLKGIHIPIIAIIPHVPDMSEEIKRRRGDRILIGLTICYVMALLVVSSADTLQLTKRAMEAGNFVHTAITEVIHRN